MPHLVKAAALAMLLATPALAAPVTFDFIFTAEDATSAGTGSMTFDDPGDGTHIVTELQNVVALFELGDFTFSWTNLVSSGLASLTTTGTERSLALAATFRPTDPDQGNFEMFGSGRFDLVYFSVATLTETRLAGTYEATGPATVSAIPLPASLPLLAAGLAGLALLRRRASA